MREEGFEGSRQERRDDWRDHGGTQDGYLGLGLDILRAIGKGDLIIRAPCALGSNSRRPQSLANC